MKPTIKKILIGVVGVIFILVFRVMKKDYSEYKEKKQEKESITVDDLSEETFSEFLQKVSEEINKKCPMTVDKDTRLDNAVVLSDNTIQYNYTWVNLEKETTDIQNIEENFAPILLKDVKTNPGLKIFRDKNVTLSYYYKDKNGNFVYNYKVTPDLYK